MQGYGKESGGVFERDSPGEGCILSDPVVCAGVAIRAPRHLSAEDLGELPGGVRVLCVALGQAVDDRLAERRRAVSVQLEPWGTPRARAGGQRGAPSW